MSVCLLVSSNTKIDGLKSYYVTVLVRCLTFTKSMYFICNFVRIASIFKLVQCGHYLLHTIQTHAYFMLLIRNNLSCIHLYLIHFFLGHFQTLSDSRRHIFCRFILYLLFYTAFVITSLAICLGYSWQ